MVREIQYQLQSLEAFISKLPETAYNERIHILEGATIGAHIRHILELVQCLQQQYHSGIVNYGLRKRDISIETLPERARSLIREILDNLVQPDKVLSVVHTNYSAEAQLSGSSYYRELLYNVEHCIHHQALIKVALTELGLQTLVDETFGMAPSTLLSRKLQE